MNRRKGQEVEETIHLYQSNYEYTVSIVTAGQIWKQRAADW